MLTFVSAHTNVKEMDDKRAHIIGAATNIEKEGPLKIDIGDMVRGVLFSMQLLSERVVTQLETNSSKTALVCLKNSPLNCGGNPRPSIHDVVSACKSDEKGKKLSATQQGRKALCEKVPCVRLVNSSIYIAK